MSVHFVPYEGVSESFWTKLIMK